MNETESVEVKKALETRHGKCHLVVRNRSGSRLNLVLHATEINKVRACITQFEDNPRRDTLYT